MDLCHSCHEFVVLLCNRLHRGTSFFDWDPFAPPKGLPERSSYCRLCNLIDYHAAKALHDPEGTLYKESQLKISCARSGLDENGVEGPASGINVSIELTPSEDTCLNGAIWASPGSPAAASGLISCDPPLAGDNSPEAFDLFRAWLQACRQDHDGCKRTLDGALIDEGIGPSLPTRVLDLGEPGATDLVLMETKGLRGNYCALSYCWGPTGTQTCVTTRDNIEKRSSGIALDSMPKTFQDAVKVAREISVRYLWIDGLCIIQGDTEDWERESKQMGSFYQMACLVIFASGATCPGEGCFVSAPRELLTVDLPFYSRSGEQAGSFHVCVYHACVYSYEDDPPASGHLGTRGWALQESYLARRSLSFMPGGPSWACRGCGGHILDERNYASDALKNQGWEMIVSRFSDMNLTHKTDRLMAVRGIATELEKMAGDTYNRGLFLSKIANQLLWTNRDTAPESEDLSDVPSWSWASIGGQKETSLWDFETFGNTLDIVAEIDETKAYINAEGCLRLQGNVLECKAYDTADIALHDNARSHMPCIDVLFSASHIWDTSQEISYIEGTASQRIGIAVFDRHHIHNVYCICLMSTTLAKFYDYVCNLASFQCLEIPVVPYSGDEDVNLVLVLVSVADQVDYYRRVGIGMLAKPRTDDESIFKTIYII